MDDMIDSRRSFDIEILIPFVYPCIADMTSWQICVCDSRWEADVDMECLMFIVEVRSLVSP